MPKKIYMVRRGDDYLGMNFFSTEENASEFMRLNPERSYGCPGSYNEIEEFDLDSGLGKSTATKDPRHTHEWVCSMGYPYRVVWDKTDKTWLLQGKNKEEWIEDAEGEWHAAEIARLAGLVPPTEEP